MTPGQLLVRLSDADVRGSSTRRRRRSATQRPTRSDRRAQTARAATPVELEQAEAQRAQAAAAVAGAKATLGYTQLRAPFAGTVQARRVNAGDLGRPGPAHPRNPGWRARAPGDPVRRRGTGAADRAAPALRLGGRAGGGRGERAHPGRRRDDAPPWPPGPRARDRDGPSQRILRAPRGPGRIAVPVALDSTFRPGRARGSDRRLRGAGREGVPALGGDRRTPRGSRSRPGGTRAGEAVIDAPGALKDGQRVEVVRGG